MPHNAAQCFSPYPSYLSPHPQKVEEGSSKAYSLLQRYAVVFKKNQ
jgi:hypothetical protein